MPSMPGHLDVEQGHVRAVRRAAVDHLVAPADLRDHVEVRLEASSAAIAPRTSAWSSASSSRIGAATSLTSPPAAGSRPPTRGRPVRLAPSASARSAQPGQAVAAVPAVGVRVAGRASAPARGRRR